MIQNSLYPVASRAVDKHRCVATFPKLSQLRTLKATRNRCADDERSRMRGESFSSSSFILSLAGGRRIPSDVLPMRDPTVPAVAQWRFLRTNRIALYLGITLIAVCIHCVTQLEVRRGGGAGGPNKTAISRRRDFH